MNPPITDWSRRRVWVVGASAGIGWALARSLHERGAQVIVSARNAQALQDFVQQHPGSVAVALDVTDPAAVAAASRQLLLQGPLDVVCYCAGHYRPMRATNIDLDDLLQHHHINTVGALHLLHAITPALLAQRHGHISLVASVAGWRGLPHSLAYGPTKAALIHLAETLYLDLRTHGIGVSVVNPGFVATRLTAQNAFPMPALLEPAQAAQAIIRGWERGSFDIHFPKRFSCLLKLLRLLPYRLYFALVRKATAT